MGQTDFDNGIGKTPHLACYLEGGIGAQAVAIVEKGIDVAIVDRYHPDVGGELGRLAEVVHGHILVVYALMERDEPLHSDLRLMWYSERIHNHPPSMHRYIVTLTAAVFAVTTVVHHMAFGYRERYLPPVLVASHTVYTG